VCGVEGAKAYIRTLEYVAADVQERIAKARAYVAEMEASGVGSTHPDPLPLPKGMKKSNYDAVMGLVNGTVPRAQDRIFEDFHYNFEKETPKGKDAANKPMKYNAKVAVGLGGNVMLYLPSNGSWTPTVSGNRQTIFARASQKDNTPETEPCVACGHDPSQPPPAPAAAAIVVPPGPALGLGSVLAPALALAPQLARSLPPAPQSSSSAHVFPPTSAYPSLVLPPVDQSQRADEKVREVQARIQALEAAEVAHAPVPAQTPLPVQYNYSLTGAASAPTTGASRPRRNSATRARKESLPYTSKPASSSKGRKATKSMNGAHPPLPTDALEKVAFYTGQTQAQQPVAGPGPRTMATYGVRMAQEIPSTFEPLSFNYGATTATYSSAQYLQSQGYGYPAAPTALTAPAAPAAPTAPAAPLTRGVYPARLSLYPPEQQWDAAMTAQPDVAVQAPVPRHHRVAQLSETPSLAPTPALNTGSRSVSPLRPATSTSPASVAAPTMRRTLSSATMVSIPDSELDMRFGADDDIAAGGSAPSVGPPGPVSAPQVAQQLQGNVEVQPTASSDLSARMDALCKKALWTEEDHKEYNEVMALAVPNFAPAEPAPAADVETPAQPGVTPRIPMPVAGSVNDTLFAGPLSPEAGMPWEAGAGEDDDMGLPDYEAMMSQMVNFSGGA